MRRYIIFAIMPFFIVSAVTACNIFKKGNTLHLSYMAAKNSPTDQTSKSFNRLVRKYSHGRLLIKGHPDGILVQGNPSAELKYLQTGKLDMAWVSTLTLAKIDRRFDIFAIPWMFPNHAAAGKVMDGEMGGRVENWLENYNLRYLGTGIAGFTQISNTMRPIEKVTDLEQLRIRGESGELFAQGLNLLGASSVNSRPEDVAPSIKGKIFHGQESTLEEMVEQKLYQGQPYVTLWNRVYVFRFLCMNMDRFKKLTPKEKEAMLRAGQEATQKQRELFIQHEEQYVKELERAGLKVSRFTPEQKQAFRAREQSLYLNVTRQVGEELMRTFSQEVNKASW